MARHLTVEDSVRLKVVADAQISPDGSTVVFACGDGFVESGSGRAALPKTNIHAAPFDGGEARRLTTGPRADTTPRWSPDGRYLAFLSDREKEGQRQVFLLPANGGEARKLTDVSGEIPSPRSLNPLKWLRDGAELAFMKADAESEEEKTRREAGADAVEHEKNHRFQRVWTVGADGGEPECVSPPGLQVWEYDLSQDGRRIAAVVSDLPYEWDWYRCCLGVFERGGSEAFTLVATARQVAKPTWSPDGQWIAYLTSNWSDRGSDAGDVMIVPASGGEPRNLTSGHRASYDSIQWSPAGDRLIATANVDGGSGVAEIDVASGKTAWLWQDEQWLTSLSMTAQGRYAAVISLPEAPSEVYGGEVSAGEMKWRKLTSLHSEMAEIEAAPMRSIHWRASDDLDIPGFLLTPPGHDGSSPLPTVALIHGGPTSAIRAGFADGHRWAQLLAAHNFAVYMPNYRGSTGRGVDSAEMNIGDMGGRDFGDIMAGLDHLIAEGIADPDRLGICGWSYGGFTTAWAVTQTDRFKAAVMGAGISDWRSFHGRSYLHTWDVIHYGGADPYDPESAHARFSPINYIRNAKTPTLILHGELDWDVPVEQSYQFFRALKEIGVETELVVYPREPHGPKEYEHLLDINRRLVDWFRERL